MRIQCRPILCLQMPSVFLMAYDQGRRPRGAVPKKNLRWGDGPCIGPPNILKSSVVGRARKHEQSKKIGVVREFFSEIVVFLVKKWSYTTFYTVKIRRI